MIDEIIKYDSEFTEATFLTKADHIFMMILTSIMENDMSSVKHYISEDIYEKYDKITKEYNSKNETRLFDEMNVKSTHIENINITEDKIIITVHLISRYMDYFIDENGEYISGINDHRIEKDHVIVFTKNINAKQLGEVRKCPGCGNSLDINASGVCPYCNQTIDMSKYDYIITEIDDI